MLAPSPWSFNRNVNLRARVTALSLAACLAGAGTGLSATPPVTPPTPTPAIVAGIHKIQHVVVIMQENRSFDQYFGTFPGAAGLALQDRMFEPNASWSLPEHLFMVSEWSARCSVPGDPMSCVNQLQNPGRIRPSYAWTDLTYLLHKHSVSWKYYVAQGTQPDCEDDQATCTTLPQTVGTPEIWNPLPWFTTVKQDGQLGNIQTIGSFYSDAKAGKLPAVSWVVPNGKVSEHPPALVSEGQKYVTILINAISTLSDCSPTGIFRP